MAAVRLHLIRHGRAAAGFGEHPDPGLDPLGHAQASDVAATLAELGPLPILTSPLRRARETAAPLAAQWATEPVVEADVGEIPSPTDHLAERSAWLGGALRGRWSDLGPDVAAWRSRLIATVCALTEDAVVFTHFVAINAVVGAAWGAEEVTVFAPTYASPVVIEVDRGKLSVIDLGRQADTDVR